MSTILQVKNLVTSFATDKERVQVLDKITFDLGKNQTLGLVGESGCGKTITSLSILNLLPKPTGNIEAGSIHFDGEDLLKLPAEKLHKIRGNRIAMIFQEPMTALNPVHKIGAQLAEVYQLHFPEFNAEAILNASFEILQQVGIPDAGARLNDYPHQLSGGMRQRIMIAMALACKPDILIADEPTTALDVTIQAQILDLMRQLQEQTQMSIIFITHDLSVIAEMCDRVVVMYAGQIVEQATVTQLFANPKHPYTKGLLASIPHMERPHKMPLPTIEGQVPDLSNMPKACRFSNRCQHAVDICKQQVPILEVLKNKAEVRCHRWQELA